MNDDIRYDFARATSLFNVINRCRIIAENEKNTLKREIENTGQWWKGESYEALKEIASASIKHLDALMDDAAISGSFLSKISDAKEDFEISAQKFFR